MARYETKTIIHVCDGCGKEKHQHVGEDLPDGFHGNALSIDSTGGHGGDFFACSERCIKKAVINAGQELEDV